MRMTGTASKGNFCRAEKQSGAQPQWWEFSTYVLRFLFIHVIITTNTTTTTLSHIIIITTIIITNIISITRSVPQRKGNDDIDENAYYMWIKSWSMFKWMERKEVFLALSQHENQLEEFFQSKAALIALVQGLLYDKSVASHHKVYRPSFAFIFYRPLLPVKRPTFCCCRSHSMVSFSLCSTASKRRKLTRF